MLKPLMDLSLNQKLKIFKIQFNNIIIRFIKKRFKEWNLIFNIGISILLI